MDSRQRVVLQLVAWAKYNNSLTVKNPAGYEMLNGSSGVDGFFGTTWIHLAQDTD